MGFNITLKCKCFCHKYTPLKFTLMHPYLLDVKPNSFIQVLGLLVLIIIVLMTAAWRAGKELTSSKTNHRDEDTLPTHEQPNDKLVIVNHHSYDNVVKAITGFCDRYNEEKYQALPRLFQVDGRGFVITFPYDVDFDIYCFFINYVRYPIELDRQLNVTGWMTGKSSEELPPDKKIMLFVPEDDKDGDNVFATAENNVNYKIDFSGMRPKKLDDMAIKNYRSPAISIADLEGKEYRDFK